MGYIQAMSNYKYDQYQQFSPGMKYIESLALWLDQFHDIDEKNAAYKFIKKNLIFISKSEMEHLIQIAYDDIIKPILFRRIAHLKGIPDYKINTIINSNEYKNLKRKCLFLGLSDGAHLDYFRRVHGLSNEQVYLTYQIAEEKADEMKEEIKYSLCKVDSNVVDEDCVFDLIFLLDDFSGSSDTLLRKESTILMEQIPSNLKKEIETYEWGGKLWYKEKDKKLVFKGEMNHEDYNKLISICSDVTCTKNIETLCETSRIVDNNLKGRLVKILDKIQKLQDRNKPLISKQVKIIIILYIATESGIETLNERIKLYKQDWWPEIRIESIQIIKDEFKISKSNDIKFENILNDYYDSNIMDEHLSKGGCDVIHGYNNCSLPLTIYHNTPNNSIYLLWAKTDSVRPLFKRVSRHKEE